MSSVVYVARRSYYQLDQRTGTRPPHMTGVLGTQRKIGRGSPQTARKKAYRCARPDTQSSQQIRQCLCKVNLAIRPQAYRTAIGREDKLSPIPHSTVTCHRRFQPHRVPLDQSPTIRSAPLRTVGSCRQESALPQSPLARGRA